MKKPDIEVRERGVQSLGFSRGHRFNLTIQIPRTHPYKSIHNYHIPATKHIVPSPCHTYKAIACLFDLAKGKILDFGCMYDLDNARISYRHTQDTISIKL